ncbi:MAG: hypothetical protein WC023_14965 [Rhodocyclaceae bacterium]
MRPAHNPLAEVGGAADLADPRSVLSTIEGIFNQRFGNAWPRAALALAIDDVVRAYGGQFPGLLACDMPYHDLRHTLDTALVMARLVDGHEASRQRNTPELGAERCVVGVLLALFHDIGYLRHEGEEAFAGAQLVRIHEARGMAFAVAFFERADLPQYQPLARLILATAFRENLEALFSEYDNGEVALACMVASADVLSQLADRFYLERCRDFLYQEFVLGGLDRITQSDGIECLLYQNAEDLLRKTPWFFESVIMKRLEHDLRGTYRYLDDHFGGQNPYVKSMFANIGFLKEVVASDDFSRLRRHPQPLYFAAA